MIVDRNDVDNSKIIIDLNGPNGNAFTLLGYANTLGRQFGFSKKQIKHIKDEMMLSSYDMLVETFDKYFGDHVVICK